jgi:pimeloyl-ACP methyl ester carboxylesterase
MDAPPGLVPFDLTGGALPPSPDPAAQPEGFIVLVAEDVRLHFHDWGGPPSAPGVLLIPGLAATAWSWAPVARRLRAVRHVVVMDLPGHGLSDAPFDGYDPAGFADGVSAVVDGAGLLETPGLVVAGHGFGGVVAAWAALRLGDVLARLVLVDGGWDAVEETTGLDVDDFLRGLDEPPEVMRSMAAFLGDRRGFDPPTWDADQERAARDSVVETTAGKVVRSVRPHALEASVRAMYAYQPGAVLAAVRAEVVALAARDDTAGAREAALAVAGAARVAAGGSPIEVLRFPDAGHNLPRYRPDAVTAALLR